MRTFYSKIACATLLATASASAQAATFVKYVGDRAAFEAAAGAVSRENFNTVAPETKIGAALNFGQFTISETQYGRYGGGSKISAGGSPLSFDGTNYVSAQLYYSPPQYESYLTFTFASPITAFGGDFGSGSVNQTFFDGLGQRVDNTAPASKGFYGFISDTPFTTLVMRSRNGNIPAHFDNLVFTNTAVAGVPEPAAWALLVLGFGAIGGSMRRRSVRNAAFAAA